MSRQTDKFYEFPQDFGHTIEQCIELREFMEDLIDRGYMQQLITRDGRVRSKTARDKKDSSRSLPAQGQQERDRRSQHIDRREVRTKNRITKKILVISGGLT